MLGSICRGAGCFGLHDVVSHDVPLSISSRSAIETADVRYQFATKIGRAAARRVSATPASAATATSAPPTASRTASRANRGRAASTCVVPLRPEPECADGGGSPEPLALICPESGNRPPATIFVALTGAPTILDRGDDGHRDQGRNNNPYPCPNVDHHALLSLVERLRTLLAASETSRTLEPAMPHGDSTPTRLSKSHRTHSSPAPATMLHAITVRPSCSAIEEWAPGQVPGVLNASAPSGWWWRYRPYARWQKSEYVAVQRIRPCHASSTACDGMPIT